MIAAARTVSGIRLAEISLPIDPSQQAVGLRPAMAQPLDHARDVGPPEFVSAVGQPPGRQITQVVVVAPLMTVAQVSGGVAIFGTAGGRAITP